MDPWLSKWTDLASDIAQSGRWTTLNENLTRLSKFAGDEAWSIRVFGGLAARLFSEYLFLKKAHGDVHAEPALLAWRARNILEISVWCIYCLKSRGNARRLFEDASRDVRQIIDGFKQWGLDQNLQADWMANLEAAAQDLSRRSAAAGIDSLDGPYERVSDAAKASGLAEQFRVSSRFLSKFVHPTAMQVLGDTDEARAAFQKDLFFAHGCLYFTGGFQALEDRIANGSENIVKAASAPGVQ